MSEKDNLPKADGKKEIEISKNEATAVSIETVNENKIKNSVQADEESVLELEEDIITEVVKTEITTNTKIVSEDRLENTFESSTLDNDTSLDELNTSIIKEEPIDEKIDTTTADIEIKSNTAEDILIENKKESTTKDSDEAVNEIHAKNAKDAEDEEKIKHPKIKDKDYHAMSMEDLVTELETLVENEKIQVIKSRVDTIKGEFSTKFSTLLESEKSDFLAGGGNTIDFYFDNPLKKRFNIIFKIYRDNRQAHYKNLEKSLKENLESRLEIISEIKGLINVEENINTTYKQFKALQESWRNAGPIPRDKYNNVWNNYHHHVEIFYDFLHLNRDLRDLDFKHNLEQKLKLIARAEELVEYEDSNSAFRELQVLHKIWKEELGPVNKEQREQIWERFSAATKSIHDKRQVYFGELDKAYEKNLVIKHDIIAQINAITKDETNNHSIWQKRIKSIENLRNQFFNAGKVPIKVNEATWAKFKIAVRTFNQKKNTFYKGLKKDQYENLQKKIALIKIAEDNKDNSDFDTTTPLMKKIQNDWKNIGHVPRKESDKVWKQFKAACNHYFNKFHDVKNESNKEEVEALNKKIELLETLKTIEITKDVKASLALIKEHIETWKAIGRVPFNKRFIDGKFNKAVDGLYNKLGLSKEETELLKYENKLESLASSVDNRLLDNEHNFLRKKIEDIKAEINQLENNLQFFSNASDDNPLIKEVHKNIKNHKNSLNTWEVKLRKIKQFY